MLTVKKHYLILKSLFSIAFLLSAISFFAQSTTYSPEEKKNLPQTNAQLEEQHKILVIPFEPKLYMSEIDMYVNKESKLNQAQIRHAFRSGLDFSIVAEFKKKYKVLSLMNDSAAYIREQGYVYQSIGYKYDLLPSTENKKDNTQEKPKIQNGQLTVTTNDKKKFMNTQITNPNLLGTLNKKYGTDIFIFINELDLKTDVDNSGKAAAGNYERTASVHYSIYDLKGNLITAGLATRNFPNNVNDPKKIVNIYLSAVAQTIAESYAAATAPKAEKDHGVLEFSSPKEEKK